MGILKKFKNSCSTIFWNRRKKISRRTLQGSFRAGKDTRYSPRLLDFTGDGSIHFGEGCHLLANFETRKSNAIVTVGDRCFIGSGSSIVSAFSITIGNDVLIGGECYISDNDGHSLDLEIRKHDVSNRKNGHKSWSGIGISKVVIEDHVWIAPRCIILKGVTIGMGAVIGAGSVVTKNIPPMSLAAGNPARVIRSIE